MRSAAEGSVAADSSGEGDSVGEEQGDDPAELNAEFPGDLADGHFAEQDGCREVGQKLEGQVKEPLPEFSQPVQWDHVTGEEVINHHVDE